MSGAAAHAKDKKHDKTIDDLIKALEEEAANDNFDPERENLNKATKTFFEEYKGEPVSGRDREKHFNKASESYLRLIGWSIGEKEGEDKEDLYGNVMRSWLTQEDLEKAYISIKKGDNTELAQIFQNAYLNNSKSKKIESMLREIELSSFEDREEAYKKIAKKLALTSNDNEVDYLRVAKNPAGAYQSLASIRQIAKNYTKEKKHAA